MWFDFSYFDFVFAFLDLIIYIEDERAEFQACFSGNFATHNIRRE